MIHKKKVPFNNFVLKKDQTLTSDMFNRRLPVNNDVLVFRLNNNSSFNYVLLFPLPYYYILHYYIIIIYDINSRTIIKVFFFIYNKQ